MVLLQEGSAKGYCMVNYWNKTLVGCDIYPPYSQETGNMKYQMVNYSRMLWG